MPSATSILYCEPGDVILRYDERKIRSFLVDNNYEDPETLILEESGIMLAAIHDATATINLMIQRSKRYSIQQIQDSLLVDPLTSLDHHPEKRAQIIRLAVDLTVANLMRRKMLSEEAIRSFVPSLQNTMEVLAALQDGKMVFDISSAIDAGVPKAAGQISGAPTLYPDQNRPTHWNPMFGTFGRPLWQ